MMRHDQKFFTFNNAYLNQIANFHLQNTFLEEELETQLFRLFAHVSLTRDPRAVRDMVPYEVWANWPPDPEIRELEVQRAELKGGQYRFDGREDEDKIWELTNQIAQKRSQREKRIVQEYREASRGGEVEQYEEPAIDLVIPERARLAEILCHQPDDLCDEERTRRNIKVVDLYVALCGKRERVKRSEPNPSPPLSGPRP
ncbi:FluG domain-containing protein [Apiospora kogelbergensis]|uniref:FluG domain-containing protein n=1 Tax=Apiospora kogelbergensis TaxID=1337665 RepID=UPI00312DA75D